MQKSFLNHAQNDDRQNVDESFKARAQVAQKRASERQLQTRRAVEAVEVEVQMFEEFPAMQTTGQVSMF